MENPGVQANVEGDWSAWRSSRATSVGPVDVLGDGLPPGLAINPQSGIIIGTITFGGFGAFRVTVTSPTRRRGLRRVRLGRLPPGTYRYFSCSPFLGQRNHSAAIAELNLENPGGHALPVGWSVSADSFEETRAPPENAIRR